MNNTDLAVISDQNLVEQMAIVRVSLGLAPGVPNEVVKATVLLGLQYGLSAANKEIQIIPAGSAKGEDGKWYKTWSPYIGIGGLTRSARRTSTFTHTEVLMEVEEMKELRGNLWDEMDVGVRITLWRLDIVRECQELGIPYHPTEAVGIWRVKGSYDNYKKEWRPDNVPNTMSRKSKAAQRGLRAAIMKAYDLSIPEALLQPVISDEILEDDIVEGSVIVDAKEVKRITLKGEDALLIQYYGLATFDNMDDEQRIFAVAKLKAQVAHEQMVAELTPEERQARTEQNATDLGMGKSKKNRLGDDDRDPLPPKAAAVKESQQGIPVQTGMNLDEEKEPKPDLVADAMKSFPGLFKTREAGDAALDAVKKSVKDQKKVEERWNKVVSQKSRRA